MANPTYIVDTSVLIEDPFYYKKYPESNIIVPIAVLNELDNLKKNPGEVGKNARVSIRNLDELSELGDIHIGVLVEETIIKVDVEQRNMHDSKWSGFGSQSYGDSHILACAVAFFENGETEENVILLTNDIGLRIKARARGIDAQSHQREGSAYQEMPLGFQTICNEKLGKKLLEEEYLESVDYDLYENECVIIENKKEEIVALGRKSGNKIDLIKKQYPWGLTPRNKEQSLAIDMIMDPKLDMISLVGSAGTGKSVLTLSCALQLVIANKDFEKMVIYRPVEAVGKEIGFLPGSVSEKLEPYFQAVLDNFGLLLSKQKQWKKDLEMWQKNGKLEFGALAYLRGRSISNALIIIDEVQNLDKETIKTILTRAGENSKLILLGDIDQIDNRDLDASNNGLTYVIDKFKGSSMAGHITLTKGERSRLATKAAEVL